MNTSPDTWAYGDFAPDPTRRDLAGLKARWLLERLPPEPAPRILDYGVGEGKHLHLVRSVKPQARLAGVDIRPAHGAVDFEFHQVAASAPLPFPAGSFDVVVSFDVLEHVASLDRSLLEIQRVLRRGGSFIGFVPAEGGLGAHGLFRLLDPHIYRDTKDHIHAFTRRELLERFESHFRIVRLAYSYHLLGATLDAMFFAMFKLPLLGVTVERFWRGQDNDFYRTQARSQTRRSLASRLVQAANCVAYYESTLLKRFSLGAKGLHFHVEKR